ncbi:carboxymuconolactone decarboxylase family protein [Parasphingorhabdus sp.]|uniref:carboxymuconolactone decarboxylase family protein n=1 Tax=Parasphingorhabdus sp. TaxID=2709688 RepID=UPI003A952B76
MSKFPSLPADPEMVIVLAAHPEGFGALFEYHDAILRGPSPLSIAERELIAAYVSGLNQCTFCFGIHRAFAELHGIQSQIFDDLIADPAAAGLDEKMLPLLAYARKLTMEPGSVTDADAAAVYAAGWNEKALFHTVSATGLFNMMTRLVAGTGIVANPTAQQSVRDRVAKNLDHPSPYADFAKRIKIAGERAILGDAMVGGQ